MNSDEQEAMGSFNREAFALERFPNYLKSALTEIIMDGIDGTLLKEEDITIITKFIQFAEKNVKNKLHAKRQFVRNSAIRKSGGLSYAEAAAINKALAHSRQTAIK